MMHHTEEESGKRFACLEKRGSVLILNERLSESFEVAVSQLDDPDIFNFNCQCSELLRMNRAQMNFPQRRG